MDNLLFDVVDPQTGQHPDCEKIALTEKWAERPIYHDTAGFLIDENGFLYVLGDGDWVFECSSGRVVIRWWVGC